MFQVSSRERLYFAACLITILNFAPVAWVWRQASQSDWTSFAKAGRNAGSDLLLHTTRTQVGFRYTPGAAWIWTPFSALTPTEGYFVNALVSLICAAAVVVIATKTFQVTLVTSAMLVFAWAPLMNGIIVGQTSSLGMLLAFCTLRGMAMESILLTAIPLWLLFYKPMLALPLVCVLALRGRWRELLVVAIGLPIWYFLSVAATGGDWRVVQDWIDALRRWEPIDFAKNAGLFITIPSVLERLSIPVWAALTVGLAIAASSTKMLRRLTPLQAGSAACLIGLVTSPHALGYDAVLALPTIFLMYRWLQLRSKLYFLAMAYVIAAAQTYTPFFRFDPVTILLFLAAGWWMARYFSPNPSRDLNPQAT